MGRLSPIFFLVFAYVASQLLYSYSVFNSSDYCKDEAKNDAPAYSNNEATLILEKAEEEIKSLKAKLNSIESNREIDTTKIRSLQDQIAALTEENNRLHEAPKIQTQTQTTRAKDHNNNNSKNHSHTEETIGSLTFPPFDSSKTELPKFFFKTSKDINFENRSYWSKEPKCRETSKWLRDAAAAPGQQGGVCRGDNSNCPIYVHTELLLSRNESLVDFRKEQIPVLSFLATQHPSVTLNILVNEKDYNSPPRWLSTLLAHSSYGKRLRIENWDIGKLNTDDLQPDFLETFKHAYENLAVPASRSDVRRYSVMYHYGGLWFDTDTVYIADVRPLMGYDYVNIADRQKLNNAAIGTSTRHSLMMKSILEHVVYTYKNNNDGSYYRFGPYLFEDMKRISQNKNKPMPFNVISACLFDMWGGRAKDGPWWWDFFKKPMQKRFMKFFQAETGPFSWHWHGAWSDNFTEHSIASVIHSNYVRQLNLDPKVFGSNDEVDWTYNGQST